MSERVSEQEYDEYDCYRNSCKTNLFKYVDLMRDDT